MLRLSRNAPTRDGGYVLQSFPGCTALYRGPLEAESVYVVGRNTADERLFKRSDLAEATEWVMANKLELENIPIVGLCAEAIELLYTSV